MDFLTRLAQRMTGDLPAVQPRLPTRFEPAAGPRGRVAPGGTIEAEMAAPNPQPASHHGGATEPLQPRPAPPQEVRLINSDAAALYPPPATIIDGALRAALGGLQENPVRPSEALSYQGTPTADRAAVPPLTPLLDGSIHPRPEPRPALRVEARLAHTVAAGSQRSEARPPTGGHPIAEAVAVETAAPTVHVHIGRIDVRASMPPPAPRPAARPAAPRSSLEDYLSGRKGGLQP
jgi:hypothetical protein